MVESVEEGLRDRRGVATALGLGEDIGSVVRYDGRLAEAAAAARIRVVTPGVD